MSDAHRDEIAKLESLYAENPEGRVFTHLAEAYRKAGDFDRAQATLADGLQRHPEYSSAHVVRGRVLMDQDRTEDAEQAFRRVLELDPHNLIAVRSLAELARGRGADDEALEFYQRLLDQEPGDEEAREFVAQLAPESPAPEAWERGEEESDGEAAFGELDTGSFGQDPGRGMSLDDDGDDAEVRTETIAQVYARQGLYDRAAEVYRELVRARPEDESLRERLAEMEQLAEAQTEGGGEVDAVSDFDTEVPRPPGIGGALDEFGGFEGFSSLPGGGDPESGPEQEPGMEPGMEPEPEPFTVDGLESAELDTTDVEPLPMLDIEVDETDPETGLRTGATPDTAEPAEDLSEELDVRNVPEPPEESPWETTVPGGEDHEEDADELSPWRTDAPAAGPDAEPDWLSEIRVDEESETETEPETQAPVADVASEGAGTPDNAALEAETASAEEVWAGADWAGDADTDTAPDSTPHAWTDDEDDDTVDASPPVREYFGGLLGWSGSAAAPAPRPAPESAPESQPSAGPAEPASPAAPAPSDAPPSDAPTPDAPAADAPEDDDDLDMFRSWLESLKQ